MSGDIEPKSGQFVAPTDGRSRRRFDWISAILCFFALAIACMTHTWPPLPRVFRVDIVLPEGLPGHAEPILTTGEFSNGDLLNIKYETKGRAAFSYDAWGAGGPTSAAISFEPGSKHRLEIEMPALAELPGTSTRSTGTLRLVFDGAQILKAEVSFHRREAHQVYFGRNEIRGNGDALFRGQLFTPNGRLLAGGPASYFSTTARIWWFVSTPLPLLAVVGLSICAGLSGAYTREWLRRRIAGRAQNVNTAPPHKWFWTSAAVASLAFTYVITTGTFKLIYPESFGVFYDYQAVSLLHGRLDVPEVALSGEAFIYDGKCYGYFGPTPAIERLPFALLGLGFGRLSRSLMLVDYVACLLAAYMLLCHAVRLKSGPGAWPSRWATALFTLTVGIGSTLFFVSSRAYIYHEAIVCGVACALWSAYFTLRYFEQPARRWWIAALVTGTLAVHARPPVGLYALVLLGIAAAVQFVRQLVTRKAADLREERATTHFAIGALAVLGVLSFNGLSYLKFKTIEGCPLRYNVQYSANRLARIDGKQFHLSNVRFGFDAYVAKPTLQLTRQFPFFATRGLDSRFYPEAKMDMTEPMAGLPYAMPALAVLALLAFAAWRYAKYEVTTMWIAVVPTAIAMFAAIAVSHRYTSDFLAFLVTAAAFGMAAVDGSSILRKSFLWFVTAATLASMAINVALTLSYQGEGVWGVPDGTQERYRELRHRVDVFFGVEKK